MQHTPNIESHTRIAFILRLRSKTRNNNQDQSLPTHAIHKKEHNGTGLFFAYLNLPVELGLGGDVNIDAEIHEGVYTVVVERVETLR